MKAIRSRDNKILDIPEWVVELLYVNFKYDDHLFLLTDLHKVRNVIMDSRIDSNHIYDLCNKELIRIID